MIHSNSVKWRMNKFNEHNNHFWCHSTMCLAKLIVHYFHFSFTVVSILIQWIHHVNRFPYPIWKPTTIRPISRALIPITLSSRIHENAWHNANCMLKPICPDMCAYEIWASLAYYHIYADKKFRERKKRNTSNFLLNHAHSDRYQSRAKTELIRIRFESPVVTCKTLCWMEMWEGRTLPITFSPLHKQSRKPYVEAKVTKGFPIGAITKQFRKSRKHQTVTLNKTASTEIQNVLTVLNNLTLLLPFRPFLSVLFLKATDFVDHIEFILGQNRLTFRRAI